MAYATTIIARSNLLAYWQCGEASGTTLADTSGNALDLTTTGSPTLGATGSGAGGTAVTFNGSNYASRTDSVVGNTPSACAVEFIMKRTATDLDKYYIAFGSSSSNNPFLVVRAANSTSLGVNIGPYQRNDAGVVAYQNPGTVDVSTGSWFHIVANITSASTTIFVNGVVAYTSAAQGSYGAYTLDRTCIGAMLRAAASGHISATMQHVAVFSRVLTLAEIYADVTAAGLTPPSSGGIIRVGMSGGMQE